MAVGDEVSSRHAPELAELWAAVQEVLKENTREKPSLYTIWFRRLQVDAVGKDSIVLLVPNKFFSDWVEKNYKTMIGDAIEAVFGKRLEVGLKIAQAQEAVSDTKAEPVSKLAGAPAAPTVATATRLVRESETGQEIQLNSDYTFGNFITGPCNQMAHAASQAVADAPGQVYNPLFLHGGVGLGKTHLLQAVCHEVKERTPGATIVYLSCETFVNQYIQAVKEGRLESFRHRYRYADVLVVDDIHFLADKERTQEEFFHTFNSLYNAKKQIILSSDSHPKEITSLEDRLVSRFKWGMVTRLEPPTYETRVAILDKKAYLRGIAIPRDVIRFIAENVDTNIRELEGAIVKVLGFASLGNRPLTLDLAKTALRDTISMKKRSVHIGDIQNVITDYFNLKPTDLQSKKRSHAISMPRHIAMYLARTMTEMSYKDIGTYFGGRDHSTVMYAEDKVRSNLGEASDLKGQMDTIQRMILSKK